MGELVSWLDFRFGTLRKQMAPLYARIQWATAESPERKEALCRELIPLFFRRLREYRDLPLDRLAARLQVDPAELESFEAGSAPASAHVISGYLRACGAFHEMAYFFQQLRELQNPSIKAARQRIAAPIFRAYGIKIPGNDPR